MVDNRGFTTIELILAIAIAGIIMGAVGSYLVFNLQGFNATQDVISVQYEGQLAMNQIVDIAKESTGIMAVSNDSGSAINMPDTVITPVSIEFRHNVREGMSEYTHIYTISYDEDTDIISCEIDYDVNAASLTDVTYILAEKVVGFTIEPLGQNVSFGMTDSIQINLTLQDNDANLELQSHVKFRNKQ